MRRATSKGSIDNLPGILIVKPCLADAFRQIVQPLPALTVPLDPVGVHIAEMHPPMAAHGVKRDFLVFQERHEMRPRHAKKVRRSLSGEHLVFRDHEHGTALPHAIHDLAEHLVNRGREFETFARFTHQGGRLRLVHHGSQQVQASAVLAAELVWTEPVLPEIRQTLSDFSRTLPSNSTDTVGRIGPGGVQEN